MVYKTKILAFIQILLDVQCMNTPSPYLESNDIDTSQQQRGARDLRIDTSLTA